MNMVIPPPPPPPLPPPPPCKNMPSKPPPPIPKHAAVPWNPAHPVQETGGPPHDSQGAEQDGAQAPLLEEPEDDDLWDYEKENHPVQETEPESEALGTSQGVEQDPGQDEAITQCSGGEEDHLP